MDTLKTLEELQEDLQSVQAEKDAIISELDELFKDAGFKKIDKMNNISYQLTEFEFKAQFSIEDSTFNFSCYITTEGDNSFNYTAKGTMMNVVNGAHKFLEELDYVQVIEPTGDGEPQDTSDGNDDDVDPSEVGVDVD